MQNGTQQMTGKSQKQDQRNNATNGVSNENTQPGMVNGHADNLAKEDGEKVVVSKKQHRQKKKGNSVSSNGSIPTPTNEGRKFQLQRVNPGKMLSMFHSRSTEEPVGPVGGSRTGTRRSSKSSRSRPLKFRFFECGPKCRSKGKIIVKLEYVFFVGESLSCTDKVFRFAKLPRRFKSNEDTPEGSAFWVEVLAKEVSH